jgi:hypothetical protein
VISAGFEAINSLNTTFLASTECLNFVKELVKAAKVNLAHIENKELKVIAVLLLIGVGVLYRIMQKNINLTG